VTHLELGPEVITTTAADIAGYLAMWAVRQHPYHNPPGLGEVVARVQTELTKAYPHRWIVIDPRDLSRCLGDILAGDPIILDWNTSKVGRGDVAFVDSMGGPSPEHDFIDIDALIQNIRLSVIREEDQFQTELPKAPVINYNVPDPDALRKAHSLWGLLDDIDTANDMAKGSDGLFRKLVNDIHPKRFQAFESDGYSLFEPGQVPNQTKAEEVPA
jgi:hypothetical protein